MITKRRGGLSIYGLYSYLLKSKSYVCEKLLSHPATSKDEQALIVIPTPHQRVALVG